MSIKRILRLTTVCGLAFILSFTACKDDDDAIVSKEVLEINSFIKDYMSFAYFWNKEMPKIDYRKQPDPEAYFYKLLKQPVDRWSFITDDIKALRDYLNGIQKTFGYSIQLYYLKSGSNQVVAFVEYVYRDSPAESAGLKRGDMFYKIDDQILTDKNYQTLLSNEIMTITLGYVDEFKNANPLSPEVSLSAVVMNTHPIIASRVLEVSGHKIGYLAYSAFIANYDSALVNVFSMFKAKGITDLVLDLRYNGGGAVSSAVKLAGLLAPASAQGSVLIKEKWNPELTAYWMDEYDNDPEFFINRIPVEENNLNLTRYFVLTTQGTASASEMVMYGLSPYMEVIQIGEKTHGKYYGSITLWDPEEKHNWGIQPIALKSENALNNINYLDGLPPTKAMVDNTYNAQLGDPEEHFLNEAIKKITTGAFSMASLKSDNMGLKAIDAYKANMDAYRTMMIPAPDKYKHLQQYPRSH